MTNDPFEGYARLWGPLAVATLGLLFMPIMDDQQVDLVDGTIERRFGTLWDTALNPNGDPALLGILLALAVVVLAVVATFRPRSTGVPIAIAVACVPIAIMLITLPATGTPKPDLSPAGTAGLALTIAAFALGVVHAIHHYVHTTAGAKRTSAEALAEQGEVGRYTS